MIIGIALILGGAIAGKLFLDCIETGIDADLVDIR